MYIHLNEELHYRLASENPSSDVTTALKCAAENIWYATQVHVHVEVYGGICTQWVHISTHTHTPLDVKGYIKCLRGRRIRLIWT